MTLQVLLTILFEMAIDDEVPLSAPATRALHRIAADYVDEVLEQIPLEELTSRDIHRALWRMRVSGFSTEAVAEYQWLLAEILARAAREGMIDRNPVDQLGAAYAVQA